jgi:hypothetical protein
LKSPWRICMRNSPSWAEPRPEIYHKHLFLNVFL